jgi:hypothetical protein
VTVAAAWTLQVNLCSVQYNVTIVQDLRLVMAVKISVVAWVMTSCRPSLISGLWYFGRICYSSLYFYPQDGGSMHPLTILHGVITQTTVWNDTYDCWFESCKKRECCHLFAFWWMTSCLNVIYHLSYTMNHEFVHFVLL